MNENGGIFDDWVLSLLLGAETHAADANNNCAHLCTRLEDWLNEFVKCVHVVECCGSVYCNKLVARWNGRLPARRRLGLEDGSDDVDLNEESKISNDSLSNDLKPASALKNGGQACQTGPGWMSSF